MLLAVVSLLSGVILICIGLVRHRVVQTLDRLATEIDDS